MNTREELKRKFNLETYGMVTDYDRKKLWEFFWSEIEAAQSKYYEKGYQDCKDGLFVSDLKAKISHLQSTLEAAEEVIQASGDLSTYNTHHSIVEKYKDKLNAYHQLKTKSQS